jgi:diaminopimelate epimerase
MEFFKYEALGNDFLVVVDLAGSAAIGGDLARVLCERHLGFGADGLLRAGPPPRGAKEAVTFELLNADGSPAEMSGNGLRCLALAVLDCGVVPLQPGGSFGVLTPVGRREVFVREVRPGWAWIGTEMGVPKVEGGASADHVGDGKALVDVGNPHLVVLGPDPAGTDVAGLGEALSKELGQATAGLNVEFVSLGPGPGELTMRVWERGVGETRSCGTGSVAAAAALHSWGQVGARVTVNQPGGALEVELRPDGGAVLWGPARRVGRCWFEPGEGPQ